MLKCKHNAVNIITRPVQLKWKYVLTKNTFITEQTGTGSLLRSRDLNKTK